MPLVGLKVLVFEAKLVGQVFVAEEHLAPLVVVAADVVDVDISLHTSGVVVHLVVPPVGTAASHRVDDDRGGVACTSTQVASHLQIGIKAMESLRDMPLERLHSRKLRSFDETAFL